MVFCMNTNGAYLGIKTRHIRVRGDETPSRMNLKRSMRCQSGKVRTIQGSAGAGHHHTYIHINMYEVYIYEFDMRSTRYHSKGGCSVDGRDSIRTKLATVSKERRAHAMLHGIKLPTILLYPFPRHERRIKTLNDMLARPPIAIIAANLD